VNRLVDVCGTHSCALLTGGVLFAEESVCDVTHSSLECVRAKRLIKAPMGWLRLVGSLLQKSPIKETIVCQRDV